ncbi:MAG: hypothetical protein ACREBS_11410 [Nitrososphaerales archaeon]
MSLIHQQAQSQTAIAFDEQIRSCVDRGLEAVGRHVKSVVYWHLQKRGNVRKVDIPSNPEMFVKGLHLLYGESAIGVERAILHEVNACFQMNCSLETGLVDAINRARSKIRN